jgi:hypothetical protein
MLWEALPTALVAAFAPPTLLIVAGVLARERPMRNALVLVGTAAAVTLVIGFVVVETLGSTDLEDRHRHPSASPAIDLGLGLAILLSVPYLAHRMAARPRTSGEKPRGWFKRHKPRSRRREGAGLLAVVGLGVVVGSPSPLYLASLHSITKGRPDAAVGVLEVLLIGAIVLLMAEVPIILFALEPDRARAVLKNANTWLARHGRVLVIVGASGVGCYFTISGLVHLL